MECGLCGELESRRPTVVVLDPVFVNRYDIMRFLSSHRFLSLVARLNRSLPEQPTEHVSSRAPSLLVNLMLDLRRQLGRQEHRPVY